MEKVKITLKTLPEATAQEVFDQVVDHLMNQNKESMNNFMCRYRNSDGLKCAAGCLIGDNEYNKAWEGIGWDEMVKSGYVSESHNWLIRKLQRVHDNFEVHKWVCQLKQIAIEFSLKSNHKLIS